MRGMHIDDLSFTQIRLIAELARLHSVSAAAQSMGLSQSAASHSLAELRKQLGDPLFARTEAGFQPTPYGERLGAAAREALEVLTAGLTRFKRARLRGSSTSTSATLDRWCFCRRCW